MSIINAAGTNYTIHTDVFSGPLDLLLNLILTAELDITRLSLARVTDQYLTHLSYLQQKSAVEVSGFLVIAAKLIQIKSEALLPRPPMRNEGDEDPAKDLIRQLKIYRKIKQTAQWLGNLQEKGQHSYIRLAPPPIIDDTLDLQGITIDDLAKMLKALYRFEEEASPISSIVTIPKLTIKNKMRALIRALREKNQISYKNLLSEHFDRIEAIVLFLSILELIKQHYAEVNQESLFSDIHLAPTEKAYQESEIELAIED
jgi:segregation and condensation protein A